VVHSDYAVPRSSSNRNARISKIEWLEATIQTRNTGIENAASNSVVLDPSRVQLRPKSGVLGRKGPKSVRLLTCLPTPATLTAMLYYLHLLLLAPFHSLVSILLRRDQDREILLLRQQFVDLESKAEPEASLRPSGEAGLVAGRLAPLETASGQGPLDRATRHFASLASRARAPTLDFSAEASTREASTD